MSKVNAIDAIPDGFELQRILQEDKKINCVAWSPDGQFLASISRERTIHLWDTRTGRIQHTFEGNVSHSAAWSPDGKLLAAGGVYHITLWDVKTGEVYWSSRPLAPAKAIKSIAWSPDGQTLALGSDDGFVRLWNVESKEFLQSFEHTLEVNNVAWSPDGAILASCSSDNTICLWEVEAGKLAWVIDWHSDTVNSIVWSPDGAILVSAANDNTVCFWDIGLRQQSNVLAGHNGPVICVAFSADGRLLASKSLDGTVRLWYSDIQDVVAILPELGWYSGLAFHPKAPTILATLGDKDTIVRIWNLNLDAMLSKVPAIPSTHYKNAKVVLVGDSGVGKSGLSLVLTERPFKLTEPTHGLHVLPFAIQERKQEDKGKEICEIFLWDLAGQHDYRLIHQFYLQKVAVALIVFDAHCELDPFGGVQYWEKTLRLIQQDQTNSPMKRLLVKARIDSGGRSISSSRTKSLVRQLNFDGYFETSAKVGRGIEELSEAIKESIDWEALPRINSTILFQNIKDFISERAKEKAWVLKPEDSLYHAFPQSNAILAENGDLRSQFKASIERLESQGLIRRLSFSDYVLLKPELLDSYASALINAVADEPDGLGSILKARVVEGDFLAPEDFRLDDKSLEHILLVAMVEDLLSHQVILNEPGDDGELLVFPSLITDELLDQPDPGEKTVVLTFDGSVTNIYARLVVRLSYSGIFKKKKLWKDTVSFTYDDPEKAAGTCTISLRRLEEGRGELTLFFDKDADQKRRSFFDMYIHNYLKSKALPDSVQRYRVFACRQCGFIVTPQLIQLTSKYNSNFVICPVPSCKTHISLVEREENLTASQTAISQMNEAADAQLSRQIDANALLGKSRAKRASYDFDVFLCYNRKNQSDVMKIAIKLFFRGVAPWLDDWDLRGGDFWQDEVQQQIKKINSVAVFVGANGMGPWEKREVAAFLKESVDRKCRVIPVLLPNAPMEKEPELPIFLQDATWVDFRKLAASPYTTPYRPLGEDEDHKDEDDLDLALNEEDILKLNLLSPMDRLVWSITGDREPI